MSYFGPGSLIPTDSPPVPPKKKKLHRERTFAKLSLSDIDQPSHRGGKSKLRTHVMRQATKHNLNNKKIRKKSLRDFYELIDESLMDSVDELFMLHEFVDIVVGIYAKYGMLPQAWGGEVEQIIKTNDKRNTLLDNGDVIYLSEYTPAYPTIKRQRFVSEIYDDVKVDELENTIREFIDKEFRHYNILNLFERKYVKEIEIIAQGSLGEAATYALGLTADEVNFCFSPIQKVTEVSQQLLRRFDPLIIIPKEPHYPGGRAGYFADVIKDMVHDLVNAYAPVNYMSKKAKKIIEKALKKIEIQHDNQHVHKEMQAKGDMFCLKELNFSELWYELRVLFRENQSISLEIMLNRPIRWFPDLSVFIKKMEKLAEEMNHPSLSKLKTALTAVEEGLHFINEQINAYNSQT